MIDDSLTPAAKRFRAASSSPLSANAAVGRSLLPSLPPFPSVHEIDAHGREKGEAARLWIRRVCKKKSCHWRFGEVQKELLNLALSFAPFLSPVLLLNHPLPRPKEWREGGGRGGEGNGLSG